MYEVVPNIIQTFLIALQAMYLVTLFIIPDLVSVLIVLSTMCMILVSLVAALHAWGVQASSVMMVELVMSIGFCSDFCVHIVHAFLTAKGTRKERAQQALIHMGMPISCASLSSIIGVMFLGFAHSFLFRTFFKTIVAIMTLGALHALCFLPVVLSLIGSHWPSHMKDAVDGNDSLQMMAPLNTTEKSKCNGQENAGNHLVSRRAADAGDDEDDDLISNTKSSDLPPTHSTRVQMTL